MTNIFNTDNLYWVFTKHAKERLANFDVHKNLKLQKMVIGDYDWYKDSEKKLGDEGYSEAAFKRYFQENDNVDMGHQIIYINEDGEPEDALTITITSKEISADGESVVFSGTIDETYGGFDVREVGIYETVEEGRGSRDVLFAICTMQPMPKPSLSTNHYIASQINCHLFSQRLVSVFDYIELEKTNNYTSKAEMNEYLSNLLYVESNLSEQISRNSQLIGYNRVQQLHDLMEANQSTYAKFGLSVIYSTLANMVDVRNFWVFDYSGNLTRRAMLKDLSLRNENLGADQLSTRYERGFEGIASWLNFNNAHYYMMDPPKDVIRKVADGGNVEYYAPNANDLVFVDLEKDKNNKIIGVSDAPFTIIFVGAQNNNSSTNTIMCKYNTFAEHPGLSVVVTPERELVVKLYSTKDKYIEFTSPKGAIPKAGTFYTLFIEYNGDLINPMITLNIDGKIIATNYKMVGPEYKGMTLDGMLLPIFSFERSSDGDRKFVNSKVCLLSLIHGRMGEVHRQALIYNLMALIGKNPCLI